MSPSLLHALLLHEIRAYARYVVSRSRIAAVVVSVCVADVGIVSKSASSTDFGNNRSFLATTVTIGCSASFEWKEKVENKLLAVDSLLGGHMVPLMISPEPMNNLLNSNKKKSRRTQSQSYFLGVLGLLCVPIRSSLFQFRCFGFSSFSPRFP